MTVYAESSKAHKLWNTEKNRVIMCTDVTCDEPARASLDITRSKSSHYVDIDDAFVLLDLRTQVKHDVQVPPTLADAAKNMGPSAGME